MAWSQSGGKLPEASFEEPGSPLVPGLDERVQTVVGEADHVKVV